MTVRGVIEKKARGDVDTDAVIKYSSRTGSPISKV